MMRAKRPRMMHHEGAQSHGHGRTRSMSEDHMGDDHLLHMDPSLMTERQQLAFLLRTTAHEQSGGDSAVAHSSESSEEDVAPRATKRLKKRIQSTKASPRNSRKNEAVSASLIKVQEPPARSNHVAARRGRPPKNAAKGSEGAKTSSPCTHQNETYDTAKACDARLHVKTSSPFASDSEELGGDALDSHPMRTKMSIVKPSPSSTSDVAHMDVFEEHLNQGDFWSLHCALCSHSAIVFDATSEPLFLCTSCDQKYPTQRSLGRV